MERSIYYPLLTGLAHQVNTWDSPTPFRLPKSELIGSDIGTLIAQIIVCNVDSQITACSKDQFIN